jgi:hypothetical protein
LDCGAGRFLFDLIDDSERWGGAAAQPIRSKRIWQKEIGGGSTQSSGRIRRGPRAREEIAESWLTRH